MPTSNRTGMILYIYVIMEKYRNNFPLFFHYQNVYKRGLFIEVNHAFIIQNRNINNFPLFRYCSTNACFFYWNNETSIIDYSGISEYYSKH